MLRVFSTLAILTLLATGGVTANAQNSNHGLFIISAYWLGHNCHAPIPITKYIADQCNGHNFCEVKYIFGDWKDQFLGSGKPDPCSQGKDFGVSYKCNGKVQKDIDMRGVPDGKV